ncbi:hypothetical protein [Salicola sp. Rm-C-2C1-2]|uniref:hypothetical protein n=1 Tax=Salicola sp. Rm-C-2C1-2 TaxID=3141321 RepID=UPI0032E3C2B5
MYKKTLLSLAVASTVGLSGCFSDGGNDNAGANTADTPTQAEQGTYPVFNPVTSELPTPNDLIFDTEAGDGSFSVDIPAADKGNPVLEALNNLSGASTVAPAVIQFNGKIDASTVDSQAFLPPNDKRNPTDGPIPNPTQNVFLIELQYASGAPVRAFSAQEPPTAPTAITAQVAAGADGAPPQDLSGRNQPEAGAALADLAQNRRYDHDVEELDGNSAIRIRPNKPLDPLKRYLVVVTDDVKDMSGDPINSSPSYTRLSDDETGDIGNSSLDTVRGLINGLWESVATEYFKVTNSSREGRPDLKKLSEENIALSYTFTTSEDEKVLSHIANPANWIADQVERATKRSAADAAMENGATDFSGVSSAVNTAVANFKPSEQLNPALKPCDSDADPASDGFQTVLQEGEPPVTLSDQFQCIGVALEGSLSSAGFPTPSARDFSFGTTTDAVALSSVLSQVVSQGDINVHQGSITLPYYLGIPDSSSGAPIKTSSWQPDSGLAAIIADATGFDIPQADPSTSEVLNYNFPFPEKQADLQVPMVTITSSDVGTAELKDGSDKYPVVIYQHGITTDRSAALAFGSKLVNSYDAATGGEELVVIAIDQPLHGVDPASNEERLTLAGSLFASIEEGNDMVPEGSLNTEANQQLAVDGNAQALADNNQALDLTSAKGIVGTVSRAGSTIPGLAPTFTDSGVNDSGVTERHFGYTANEANQPVEMNFDASAALGTSGSLFINLSNFLNGRDNLRQGSLDLMNLRATIENMAGLDGSSTYFVGHSLGTQTGGTFAGAVKQSNAESQLPTALSLAGVHLQTPVAGIVRLLENSPSFAPTVVGGLQASAGISQGDSSYETYLNVNQAALDSADPINFAPQLADSNTLISQVNGDRTTPNAADTRFSDMIEGVPGYDGGPLNVFFPNGLTVDSFEAPLTGSEALAKLMRLSAGGAEINTGTSGQTTPAITRYLAGTHGVPVLPQAESVDAGGVKKDRNIAQSEKEVVSSQNAQLVFGELVSQTLQMVQGAPNITGGKAAEGAGSNVIQKD